MECYQYRRKVSTYNDDVLMFGNLSPSIEECDFRPIDNFLDAKVFIEKYEWLGKLSNYPTHLFGAYYGELLAGVVVMDMPTAFSKLLGEDTRKLERLISRGATSSWSPHNLGSSLIMYSIRWVVKNTPYRLFTAYSDPEAGELGTIYQACNFYYLGNRFGTKIQYKYNGRWVSDRSLRSRSAYKRYAKQLDLNWNKDWQDKDRILWDMMPNNIMLLLKQRAKDVMTNLESRIPMLKHKYAYVLGSNKFETKKLRDLFVNKNQIYEYPKERGK